MTLETVTKHPMEGLVRCGACGETMTATTEGGARYACPRRLRGGLDDCPVEPVDAGGLHRRVMQSMLDELLTGATLRRLVRSVRGELEEGFRQGEGDLEGGEAVRPRWDGEERACQVEEARIQREARNPDTYLEAGEPEALRGMFAGTLERVLVNPGGVTVRYAQPLPDGTREREV